jgi:hypothetical protein
MAPRQGVDVVRWTARRAVAPAVVGVLIAAQAGAASWDFTPHISLGQTWTDNVNLAPADVEESEWITELKPGFVFALDSPRARAQLDYDLQVLRFADFSEFDDEFHQARGTGNFVLAPDSLFLSTFGRYEQQTIDPAGRIAFDNFFNTDNRTDSLVFGVSPYNIGRWGSWGESLLRYDYQTVRYSNSDPASFQLRNSDRQAVSAALGSPQARTGFSWRASGLYSRTEFDTAPEFEYGRVGLDVGLPVGWRTRLTASGGLESDVSDDPSAGGLDSAFWYVGFAWEPSELQSLVVKGGKRYFGTAWEVHWARRGSKGEIGLDYEEEPITSTGVLGDESVFEPGFQPGGVPRLDTRVFLRKRLAARANYRFVRSTLATRVYVSRQEYEDATGGTEEYFGAAVTYDWDLATRTRVGGAVDWTRRDFGSDLGNDDQFEYTIRVTRELTRVLSAVLRGSHFRRTSDSSFDYRVNLVSLTVRAQF